MEFLIFWMICAAVTAVIASSKGRSGFGWFLIGALIGIFGLILVACLPSLKPRAQRWAEPNVAQTPFDRGMKVCPDCAEEVKLDARVCRFCRHDFAAPKPAPQLAPWDGVIRR